MCVCVCVCVCACVLKIRVKNPKEKVCVCVCVCVCVFYLTVFVMLCVFLLLFIFLLSFFLVSRSSCFFLSLSLIHFLVNPSVFCSVICVFRGENIKQINISLFNFFWCGLLYFFPPLFPFTKSNTKHSHKYESEGGLCWHHSNVE